MFKKIISLLFFGLISGCSDSGEYFPSNGWRKSTPAEQGLDAAKIEIFLDVLNQNEKVHSVLIIRRGFIVTEKYYNGFDGDDRENLVSMGECLISALYGTAFRKGIIKDEKAELSEFFNLRNYTNYSQKKDKIDVTRLLSMSSGIVWPWMLDPVNTGNMINASDSTRYALNFPVKEDHPVSFNFCGANTQIAGGILSLASGMNLAEYADENIFSTIGIKDVLWEKNKNGEYLLSTGLHMRPSEFAKLGYLYLKNGRWLNSRIIPEWWINSSTSGKINCAFFPDDTAAYGFGWWVEPYGYSAKGWSGNYLYILPELEMLILITGESPYFSVDENNGRMSFRGEMRDGPSKNYVSELIGDLIVRNVKK